MALSFAAMTRQLWVLGALVTGLCVAVVMLVTHRSGEGIEERMSVGGKIEMPISGQAKILWGDSEKHDLPPSFMLQVFSLRIFLEYLLRISHCKVIMCYLGFG